jgi:peptidoglycan-associated lipoprotein
MRRALVLVLPLLSFALAGCPTKPKNGECKSSGDCAAQEGYGKVCVEGRCQECSADGDCQDGFVCRDLKCVPRPECTSDADCPAGRTCEGQKCVEKAPAAEDTSAAAADAEFQKTCGDATSFTLFYGFDESTLSPEAQDKLQKLSECLKQRQAKKVVIAGHADERGTTAYNVALGNRRAEAAKKYLADLGAGAGTDVSTVSYGKEKPVCEERTEACWSKNRRAEFEIQR